MSAAYIKMHFRLGFFMEAYNINPDMNLNWVKIVCNIRDDRADSKSHDWQARG